MGYLLKSGEVGNIGLKHQKAVREATVSKWNDLGFLEGLNGHTRENVALLYENTASSLITETTDAGNSGSFETVVFPIVRRVFSKLLANDIVSVQAMNLPIVKLCGFNSSGAGRLTGPNGNEMDTEEFLASLDLTVTGNLVDKSNKTILTSGDKVPFRVVTQRYGKGIVNYGDICTPDGCIYLEADLTHPVCVECGDGTFDGYIGAQSGATAIVPGAGVANLGGTSIAAVWRQYEDLELESQMGEVSFELDSVTVSVTERKLRATWTPELAQDVSAFHNIDAEAELTALLSEQVAAEIDREILRDLRKGAAWQLRWDYNGWKRLPNNNGYTQKDWNQTLVTAINQISAQIHKSTLRGGANFIVVSSEVSAIFDDLEYFHVSNASPEQDNYNMGIERVGSLSGRYTVYRDPYAPAKSVLVGHKGKSLLDTGYIYAPYVPLQLTPTMYNPFNFVPVKGIMTRYAKKFVNNRFYGQVSVDGLRTFDVRELR